MRSVSTLARSVAGAVVLAAGLSVIPASAYDLNGERFHADSFGNLVIYSPAGYKRIVVGQGHAAAAYQADHGRNPDVVYGDDDAAAYDASRRCRVEPGIFHGRSYMYGLEEGVVPTPARRVCD